MAVQPDGHTGLQRLAHCNGQKIDMQYHVFQAVNLLVADQGKLVFPVDLQIDQRGGGHGTQDIRRLAHIQGDRRGLDPGTIDDSRQLSLPS